MSKSKKFDFVFLMIKTLIILCLLLINPLHSSAENCPDIEQVGQQAHDDRLVVLWTTADKEVAMKMLTMYSYNAMKNEWWEEIVLIVWGPSAKLLAEDPELQEKIKELIQVGITVKACKGCSDQYTGVTGKLQSLGVDVLYVGKEFTDYLKSSSRLITL